MFLKIKCISKMCTPRNPPNINHDVGPDLGNYSPHFLLTIFSRLLPGHEEMRRIPTHLYTSTKILFRLTQSRNTTINQMLILIFYSSFFVYFVSPFHFLPSPVPFRPFFDTFWCVFVSQLIYPSIFSDSFGRLIFDFLISSSR